jgi:hypothetical protein
MLHFRPLPDSLIAATEKILQESPAMGCNLCGVVGECEHTVMEDGANDPGIPPVPVPNDLESDEASDNPPEAETQELSGQKTEVEINPEMEVALPQRLR